MTEHVRGHGFGDFGSCGRFSNHQEYRLGRDRLIATSSGKQPTLGAAAPAILAKGVEQNGRQHDVTIAVTLGLPDVNDHTAAVDIAHRQIARLRYPQAASVEGHEQHPVQ